MIIMKSIIALFALVAAVSCGNVVPTSYLTRAPAFDSAVIKSDRLGGNFAYSVAESHAYAQHTPIVQHVQTPVGVSYSAPQQLAYAHVPQQHIAYSPYASHASYGAPLSYSSYNPYAPYPTYAYGTKVVY